MSSSRSQVRTELDKLLLTSPGGREPCPLVAMPVMLDTGVDPPGACRLVNVRMVWNILQRRSSAPFWNRSASKEGILLSQFHF